MKILVLEGGLSPERDVSKKSSSLIANALLSRGHEVAKVDLYEGIEDDADLMSLYKSGTDFKFEYSIPETEPDLEKLIAEHGGRRDFIGPRIVEMCRTADSVFLGLHGAQGENGQLQAFLDAYDIKYTGSGYVGCCITMDKDISKALAAAAGIKTAKWIRKPSGKVSSEEVISEIGLPCVVKPIGCGSSCGVSIVNTEGELSAAIAFAEKYKQDILVEQFIKGTEITVGILNGKALPVIEIVPKQGFYDYKNKYQADLTDHYCPARLTDAQTKKAQAVAEECFKALRMSAYGRIDIIYDTEKDICWFIEGNNLPGMTNASLLPEAAKVMGIGYEELCERIAMSCGKDSL